MLHIGMNLVRALALIAAILPSMEARAEHCTDKWTQKASIEAKYDEVTWSELEGAEFLKLAACVAAEIVPDGAATPLMFACFADVVGPVAAEIVAAVGVEVAAQMLYDLLETGQVQAIDNIVFGRQVWSREECLPDCDDRWLGCIPLPATNAFFVAWDYSKPPPSVVACGSQALVRASG